MKLKQLIESLKHIETEFGNIEVDLQVAPGDARDIITAYPDFFIVPEPYDNTMLVKYPCLALLDNGQ